jgi:hypothetical protein
MKNAKLCIILGENSPDQIFGKNTPEMLKPFAFGSWIKQFSRVLKYPPCQFLPAGIIHGLAFFIG